MLDFDAAKKTRLAQPDIRNPPQKSPRYIQSMGRRVMPYSCRHTMPAQLLLVLATMIELVCWALEEFNAERV
jgi:hypothetical protein